MGEVDRGRRRFLLATVALAASVAIGPRTLALLAELLPEDDAAIEAVRALIAHRAHAAQLGSAYLAGHPGEGRPALLLHHLAGPLPPRSAAGARDRIAARIRADYASARTVTVEGWILSRTEARLYALVALA
jgi:hypothetical protein